MNYDRTTKDYVEEDNQALTRFLREIKLGLAKLSPLELTTTRDGRGGQQVTGATRKQRLFYESVYDQAFLDFHERSIDQIQYMLEGGMMLSPNPKVSNVEKIEGGNIQDGAAENDSIRKKYDLWRGYEKKGQRPAVQSALRVFGRGESFSVAVPTMRGEGIQVNLKTVKGLAELGLELYMRASKKVDRDSE